MTVNKAALENDWLEIFVDVGYNTGLLFIDFIKSEILR